MARPEFRAMVERGETVLAPCALDAITGRLLRRVGFKCLYIPGSAQGIEVGESEPLLTHSQVAAITKRVSTGVYDEMPIIVDAQHGFGEPVHVQASIRAIEAAGATAIHVEDQVFPQRVHYFSNIEHVVTLRDYKQRIEYAVKARKSPHLMIIARNDVYRSVEGGRREEAVARAYAALEVGADAIFITGGKGAADLEYFRKAVPDVPMVAVAGSFDGITTLNDYVSLGYQIILVLQNFHSALHSLHSIYKEIRSTGCVPKSHLSLSTTTAALIAELLEPARRWRIEDNKKEST